MEVKLEKRAQPDERDRVIISLSVEEAQSFQIFLSHFSVGDLAFLLSNNGLTAPQLDKLQFDIWNSLENNRFEYKDNI
jgi:hypothetical protein